MQYSSVEQCSSVLGIMSVEWYKSLRETRMHSQRSDFGVRRKLSDNVMSVEIVHQKWGFVCRLECIMRVMQKRQYRIYVWNYVSGNFGNARWIWIMESGRPLILRSSHRRGFLGSTQSLRRDLLLNSAIFRGDTVRLYSCIHSVSPVDGISSRRCSSRSIMVIYSSRRNLE